MDEQRKLQEFNTIKYTVGVILRDNPDLRTLDKREKVWILTKQSVPNAKFSTVERMIRKLQNDHRLYLPEYEDDRYNQQAFYKAFFSGE